jgi:hypothetical protein
MNTYGEWRYSFKILDLGTRWCEDSFTLRPLYPGGKSPGTYWIGSWVRPRAGLDAVEYRKISYPCWESNPGRPAGSLSLYRLGYSGYFLLFNIYFNIILQSTSASQKSSIFFRFSAKILYQFFTSLICTTCPAHLTVLNK